MRLHHFSAFMLLSLGLSGCVTTHEMPLAPNVVRIDTRASGLLSMGQAAPKTMRRAAELTLQGGYTHFRFDQASTAQGSQYAGGMVSVSGGFATVTPIRRPVESVGVTVYMFHANEPGAKGAFDAAQVLKQYPR